MCGRKKKFGMNLMGTVDHLCRFLDVQISHPGSTSDFLAFAVSDLKAKLEQPNFLAPGLVLFGDNAYSNSQIMVTPFKGSRDETYDAFNFYHSQVRIQVECAFGRLVHRWGVLRRPIHMSLGIKKTCALVMALCRLHNFCIDCGTEEAIVPAPLAEDQAFADCFGGVQLQPTRNNEEFRPIDLLGHHFHDANRNIRRRRQDPDGVPNTQLPQQTLYNSVVNQGLRRPTPRHW
jgi:hypothetical protein